jgi:hypothetical protein
MSMIAPSPPKRGQDSSKPTTPDAQDAQTSCKHAILSPSATERPRQTRRPPTRHRNRLLHRTRRSQGRRTADHRTRLLLYVKTPANSTMRPPHHPGSCRAMSEARSSMPRPIRRHTQHTLRHNSRTRAITRPKPPEHLDRDPSPNYRERHNRYPRTPQSSSKPSMSASGQHDRHGGIPQGGVGRGASTKVVALKRQLRQHRQAMIVVLKDIVFRKGVHTR